MADDVTVQKALVSMEDLGTELTQHTLPERVPEEPGFFVFAMLTVVLAIIGWIIVEMANYREIVRNWDHYRCNPSITPFASFYGHNLKETLNFCVGQIVREHSADVIDPIYGAINAVSNTMDGAFSTVKSIEGGIKYLLKGFTDFVVNFVNSFRLLGTRVRMAFIRMKDIFDRVYGIFIAFAYAAISAITFGSNLICNPLVVFVGTIAGVDICCFAPDTGVRLADGSVVPICKAALGQQLAGGGTVTATFQFNGDGVSMVRLPGGVIVSDNHSLRADETGAWIPAGQWPGAVAHPCLPEIWCLSTTNCQIPIVTLSAASGSDLTFTDYEESNDPAVATAAQAAAESALQPHSPVGAPVADYGLGLDPDFCVQLWGGRWKKLSDIRIGHRLASGAFVSGVVRELCSDVRLTPKGWRVSAAQLLRLDGAGQWSRAEHMSLESSNGSPQELCQIFTSTNESFVVGEADRGEIWEVRDYQEWHGAETQDPYDKALGLGLALVPSLDLKSEDSR
jgi:hypothetical protein